jgi:hypothetical protein
MDPRNLPADVPWLTAEGYFDPAQFPIDRVLKQAISPDEKQVRSGVSMLQSMHHHGRAEAGVFLLGLLLTADDNWERRIAIVEALKQVQTKACADLLFGELNRVKSSNTTRRYLTMIIKVLAQMPSELVLDGFATLAQDKRFSHKMRERFKAVLANDAWDDVDLF